MADTSGIINTARTTTQDPSVMTDAAGATADNGATSTSTQTQAPSAISAADINTSYNTLFGRPAEDAAIPFWTNYAQQNGLNADQLHAAIAANAQNDDKNAEASLNGNGNLSNTWVSPGLSTADVGTKKDYWDSSTNQWVAPQNTAHISPVQAPSVSTYAPTLLGDTTKWDITPDQTVAGQLTKVLDPNNPIIQQAMSQGMQIANERGLLNSSISQGAAQNAAYTAAVPIATSDAATNAKASGYNADESNQFKVQNANYSNTASQFNAAQTNDMAKTVLSAQTQQAIAQLQAQTQTNLAYLDDTTKTNLAKLGNDNQVALAQIEANYHDLMQSNASASDLFKQITANITNISMSNELDATAKQTAVNNQLQMLKNGLGVNGAITNLNLGSLLDFSGVNTQASAPASTTSAAAPALVNDNQSGGM
jgi:hypothetical protein